MPSPKIGTRIRDMAMMIMSVSISFFLCDVVALYAPIILILSAIVKPTLHIFQIFFQLFVNPYQ